ncbi:hypothetical protein OHC33_007063 [Knufia fluminis]|uniref:DUF726-domain-containing protein n=1 Tax=Knufia fluminis TaxID=191047 RepID=A0AAN8I6E8_9EURO|nr:hypothetical protein OHC33_007063 [Knufia fluminis]
MPFSLPKIPGITSKDEQKQDASLDDILPNSNERIDLILLAAICIDHMRDGLTAGLESQGSQQGFASEQSQNEEHMQKGGIDLHWGLSSSNTQELKRAGVKHINDWRGSVLNKMGESMKVKVDAVKSVNDQYKADLAAHHGSHKGTDSHHTTPEAAGVVLPFPKVTLPRTLEQLDEKKRALVIGAVLFILLSLETYPAQSRALMAYLCQCFALPFDVLSSVETSTAATLLEAASKSGMDAEEARKKEADQSAFSRKWKVGLATVAGAAAIGITGGLAAPVIIGLAGTIMGGVGLGGLVTLLGATIANPITIGALFGAFGGRMTGRAMDAYSKEVRDFKFLPVQETKPEPSMVKTTQSAEAAVPPPHKLRVAIGISGWVTKESDVSLPWRIFSSATLEPFALRYEQDALIALGTTLDQVFKDQAFAMARGYAIGLLLPALSAALAPLGLFKFAKIIDNPFTVAMERSDKAGKVLAHALMDRCQGERPVTLVGFSVGARVVFSCLEELAAQKAFGLVENVILIGSPIPTTESSWRRMRTMVAGRLINVYTQKDMLLGFLYRARNVQLGIAGLQAITSVPGVENKDVSSIVTGHNQYRLAIGRILRELHFADLDLDQVKQEVSELETEKAYEQEEYEKAKREGRLKDIEDEHGQIKMGDIGEADAGKGAENPGDVGTGKDSSLEAQLEKTHISRSGNGEQKPALPARH